MFLRKPGTRWSKMGGGFLMGIDEIFAPYSYEVKLQEEARQVIPAKRENEDEEPTE